LGVGFLFSQSVGLQKETNQFTERVDLLNNNDIYHFKSDDSYTGTPYYYKTFLLGNVYLKGELLERNVSLRLNLFADEIEYKKSSDVTDGETLAIIKSEDISVSINNEMIIYKASKGFFIVVFDGVNYSLLKKIEKKYYPFKKAATSLTKDVPAVFIDKIGYYLVTKDGLVIELPNSKVKKLKAFDTNYELAKKYTKEKNLDLNKERDLKRLFIYLDNKN